MTRLNQRQRKFTINYFKTGNATQSAIDAGYAPTRAEVTGSELVRKSNVSAYLAELNSHLEIPAVATKIEREEKLTEVIRVKLPDKVTAKERILATSELNKMEGDYAPEKHAVLGDIVIEIVHRDKDATQ